MAPDRNDEDRNEGAAASDLEEPAAKNVLEFKRPKQIGKQLMKVLAQEKTDMEEPEDLRFFRYQGQYEAWAPDLKGRCSWEEVKRRLLANDGHSLRLANALKEGGVLFGLDANGNPLIADAGMELAMMGMSYFDTYKNLGDYELFAVENGTEMGPEMRQFEAFTGQPFVSSPKGKDKRSSWLETGKYPSYARVAAYDPDGEERKIAYESPFETLPERGVRRLLRLRA